MIAMSDVVRLADFRAFGCELAVTTADIDKTRDILLKIEATAQLALHVLDQAGVYGNEAALAGVHEVFTALNSLLRD